MCFSQLPLSIKFSSRIKILVFSIFFGVAFFSFSLPSQAEYINTKTDGEQRVWLDLSSKEGTGNIRRISELINFKDKQFPKLGLEYSSIVYQYQFNCNRRAFKVLFSIAYEKHQGQGKVIFFDNIPTPSYVGIKDGSSVYEAFAFACK